MHILVVDDKQAVVKTVSELLINLGYVVTTASNGLDALSKAQSTSFDMYIIDHLMPVMNGVQLIKNLKSKEFTEDVPVLFMTTQDTSTLDELDEYKYFDAVISKPIDQDLFYSVINQLLPQNTVIHSL